MMAQSLISIAIPLLLLYDVCSSQTISIDTGTSTNSYLYTESVKFGTPTQSFKLLIDTTDNTSWVYNKTANVPSSISTFDASASSTFNQLSYSETYSYQNESTEIQFANDTITIGSSTLYKKTFAVATDNFTITDTESVSGVFSLNKLNKIIDALYNNKSIANKTVSVDVMNNKLHIGPYTPSSYNNLSNATDCSSTSNALLNEDWTFDINVTVNGVGSISGTFKGVIDTASPYITIYAKTAHQFQTLWATIEQSSNAGDKCNYTTLECSDTSIMTWMNITAFQIGWSVSIFQEDILDDSKILFLYDADRSFTTDTDYVLFLGRPFLKRILVTLDYEAETLTFYSLKEITSSLDWTTIGIVFGCVAAFAALFFAGYYWKYGKISAPSNHDVEEQVSHSLLRGPVQAVGSGQAVGASSGAEQRAAYPGLSGLDEDEDYQHQLQQAQRQSAIEAQQRRESELARDRERRQREEEEQKQQQMEQQQQAQVSGGRIGGSAARPQDADDLRQRRLKFLEEQQKKQDQDE